MRAIVISALCVALCGCAGKPGGLSTALEYKTAEDIIVDGISWRVLEHPDNTPAGGKLMTTPSLGNAAAAGFISGLTLGLANVEPHEDAHEGAARAWLNKTNREKCKIVKGYELVRIQFEFIFECVEAPIEPPARAKPIRKTQN